MRPIKWKSFINRNYISFTQKKGNIPICRVFWWHLNSVYILCKGELTKYVYILLEFIYNQEIQRSHAIKVAKKCKVYWNLIQWLLTYKVRFVLLLFLMVVFLYMRLIYFFKSFYKKKEKKVCWEEIRFDRLSFYDPLRKDNGM